MEQTKSKTVEELIIKYKQKLGSVKTLLKDTRIPISNFTLAQEQCFIKILEELKDLNSLEQTKAKTALLFLSCKLDIPTGLIDETAHIRVSKALECIQDLQSHIANLEAQNKELREALKKIYNDGCDCDSGSDAHQYMTRIDKIAEQALKEDKQDG